MKRWLLPIFVFVCISLLFGGATLVTGLVSIKASSGHWPVTAWFLDFAKKRSIGTHSLGISAPDLSDPALIQLGAGAFQNNCVQCHGAPGGPMPPVPAAMTPHPPALLEVVPEYSPDELFYIVRHGIKFTGMPAWPADQRDDEVWAVVAFLKHLPDLDAEAYSRLIRQAPPSGTPTQVVATIETCAGCHGRDGRSRGNPLIPILAGQSATYLQNSLNAYAAGMRSSGVMEPMATPLAADQITRLAEHYAGLPPHVPPGIAHPPELLLQGEEIAINGDVRNRIPSCIDCHGRGGVERREDYPLLDGQSARYLARQLELFQSGARGGSEFAHIMHKVVRRLDAHQIDAVSAYFESRPLLEQKEKSP